MSRTTMWTDLLDRVEARVRRLEAATAASGQSTVDPGPDPTLERIPLMAPTAFERTRLTIVLAAHRCAQEQFAAAQAATR